MNDVQETSSPESSTGSIPHWLADWKPSLDACCEENSLLACMAPELAYGRHRGPCDPNTKLASVMILVARDQLGWYLPLTVRSSKLADHAGQVSLPGGRVDPDESIQNAALRELEEEMGVSANRVKIHGVLPAVYVYASNHLVHPIVAWSDHTLQYQINEHEVDEVLRFALDTSRPNVAIQRRNVNRRGAMILTPGFEVDRHFVWGATAIILGRFLNSLGFQTILKN
ncbi:MAG: CoA pyrophosphatase [Pirellulales bacterium]